MSGFSAEWLALREPADHRAVDPHLRAAFASDLAGRETVAITDIGCGTGSNLRGLSPYLGQRQNWRLVDYDAGLLGAARESLSRWADEATTSGDTLHLLHGGRQIEVEFLRADLSADLAAVLDHTCDAVTAAAFFDLVSREWIACFCMQIAARRLRFYTVLTYDGREIWTPPAPSDAVMLAAFHAHQASDKGFGAAAGPAASQALADGFRQHGSDVSTALSPWRLAGEDCALMQSLARGSADAVSETGIVPAAEIESWRNFHLDAAAYEIGHIDLYARPR